MRRLIFLISFFLSHSVFSQVSETDSSGIDSEIMGNAADLPSEEIELSPIKLPKELSRFSGIRVIDIRPVNHCIGFVKLKGQNIKIILPNGLAATLNSKFPATKSSENGDSLIICIKHFWETRISQIQADIEEENTDGSEKSSRRKVYAFFHITAAFFIKNEKGLVFCGKFDSLITNNRKLLSCYATFPNTAIAVLLEGTPANIKDDTHFFTEEQVIAGLAKPIIFPKASVTPNGIFLNYDDFKKGKLLKKDFTLSPRVYGYKIVFESELDNQQLTDNFWGVCYKNQFYIKYINSLNRLNSFEQTFTALSGSLPSWKKASPSNLLYRGMIPKDILAIGDATEINKYTKIRSDFFPLLLNPLTGFLE